MNILKELIKFADKYPVISAVYKGHSPEEESYLTYYFLAPAKFNPKFEEKIADLEVVEPQYMKKKIVL